MTGWVAPTRTDAALAAHAAADADRLARPERYRLDVDRLAAAADRDGTAADFADGWRDGLEQYLASAVDDGRLTALGTAMVASTAVARLRAGANLASHLRDHPDVGRRSITPPIVIIGGWRTGTTFLFRLLAGDPRLRAPLPSELTDPTRIATLRPPERERLIDASARAHQMLHSLNPQLRAIHDSGPRLPEECVLGMGADLHNWGFTSTVRLDGYADWLAGRDLGSTYLRHRQLLQVLDEDDGRRWLLKAPAHTAELRHLVAAFPGAVVVHLHRDIVETVASASSLFAVFRSTYSDHVDGADVGRYQTDQTERWLRRAAAFRSSPASADATFVDLDYTDLVRNPAGAVTSICAAAGLDPPPDPAAFVDAHHAAHPRHGNGAHRYTAADFGLDEHELRERFGDLC